MKSAHRSTPPAWGGYGGRIMMTSLCALTLEIYYRYLPLYDLDQKGAAHKAPLGEKENAKPGKEEAKQPGGEN
jgi:hypothetical protein